jgi:hypothetical protein
MGAFTFKGLNLRNLVRAAFDATDGHDHDGVNSKAVAFPGSFEVADGKIIVGNSEGVGTAVSVSGDATLANTGALSVSKLTIASQAAGDILYRNSSAWVRLAKGTAGQHLAMNTGATAPEWVTPTHNPQMLSVFVEDLSANVDIADRVILECPTGYAITLTGAVIISNGTASGIDDSNKCTVLLEDNSSNAIVSKEFDTDPAFPAAGSSVSMGALDGTHKILAAGEKLLFSVTNGTTADTPAFLLQITYTIAAAS